uniref:Macaca fascicularis brain cDNA clone: QmoA-11554, similar to human protein phosphatase 1, catalytic subunit, beta isoform(PPP1CB), transcript variant 2, mRNA, RefSeq: NM_206877.1 n=1 Tax=Macaca fascicularis TaxID=9541 RepID=I7GJ47_MACFA|nr:unnamed protein product [Macaca fascicularis]
MNYKAKLWLISILERINYSESFAFEALTCAALILSRDKF